MTTSLHEGFVRGDKSGGGVQLESPNALDAAAAEAVINNAAHAADMAFQPRIAWQQSEATQKPEDEFGIDASSTYGFVRIASYEFPVHLRADGSALFRVEIAGSIEDATTATATFAIVVGAPGTTSPSAIALLGDNVATAVCDSETSAWLDVIGDNLIYLAPGLAADAQVTTLPITDSADTNATVYADPVTILACDVYATLSEAGAQRVYLDGLSLCEYVGP